MQPIEQIKSNILSLQEALLNAHPTMPTLLQTIHKQLKADPECVTLLNAEDIGIIISGLKRQTATEIITSGSAKTKTKKMAALSVDDL